MHRREQPDYSQPGLIGRAIQRGLTFELPKERVKGFLTPGLELGDQNFTSPGTHPVSVCFYDMFNVRMNFPALAPNGLTYYEQVLGIPYVYTTGRMFPRCGPFFFMPMLKLSSFWATLGGMVYWGYNKRLASVEATDSKYVIRGLVDRLKLLSFDYRPVPGSKLARIDKYPKFEQAYHMFQQPFISDLPVGLGPFRVCSQLERDWKRSLLRPLNGTLSIDDRYHPALKTGRFGGRSIEESCLGAFELHTPWLTTFLFSPLRYLAPHS